LYKILPNLDYSCSEMISMIRKTYEKSIQYESMSKTQIKK